MWTNILEENLSVILYNIMNISHWEVEKKIKEKKCYRIDKNGIKTTNKQVKKCFSNVFKIFCTLETPNSHFQMEKLSYLSKAT